MTAEMPQGETDLLHVTNAMWAWNPDSADVIVVPWPDTRDLSAGYDMTSGACSMFVRRLTPTQQTQYVLSEALRLMVSYHCEAAAVHRAFLTIHEYRAAYENDPY